VDRWETFPPADPFDHVAFNTPSGDAAFAFINAGLDKLLAPSGLAQVWLVSELTVGERDWTDHVTRHLERPEHWEVAIHVHTGSPSSLPMRYLSGGVCRPAPCWSINRRRCRRFWTICAGVGSAMQRA
jgi:hypothetical protein